MVTAPFALAARMHQVDGWRDLARPAILAGVLLLAVLLGSAALERKTGGGYRQRGAIVLVSVGVATLALRVRALAVGSQPAASLDPSGAFWDIGRPLRAKAFRASMSGQGGAPGGQDRGRR
jgi:hypothetical protein